MLQLNWVYGPSDDEQVAVQTSASGYRRAGAASLNFDTLAALPQDLRTALADAVIRLDTVAVGRAIDGIRAHDARVADDLAILAGEFKYERMLHLLQMKASH